MLNHDNRRRLHRHSRELCNGLWLGEFLDQEFVESGRPDDVHVLGAFTHPTDALGTLLRCGEVHVRELCDRVTHRLVEPATTTLAPMNVRKTLAEKHGRDRRGEGLGAIAEDEHNVRVQPVQGVDECAEAASDRFAHVLHGVALGRQRHTCVYPKPVPLYLADRRPEAFVEFQVHARCDELKAKRVAGLNRPHDGAKQTVLGTGSGDDTDGFHVSTVPN